MFIFMQNGDTVATSINGNNLGTLTQTGGAGAKRSVAIGRDAKVTTTAELLAFRIRQ